jgi:hypothetical protein
MVRACRMSRCHGVGGRGMPPLSVSMLEGYNPQGDEQTNEKKQVAVGDVVGMMRFFQRMLEELIIPLDQDERRTYVPNDGSQCPPLVSSSVHKELEKSKLP